MSEWAQQMREERLERQARRKFWGVVVGGVAVMAVVAGANWEKVDARIDALRGCTPVQPSAIPNESAGTPSFARVRLSQEAADNACQPPEVCTYTNSTSIGVQRHVVEMCAQTDAMYVRAMPVQGVTRQVMIVPVAVSPDSLASVSPDVNVANVTVENITRSMVQTGLATECDTVTDSLIWGTRQNFEAIVKANPNIRNDDYDLPMVLMNPAGTQQITCETTVAPTSTTPLVSQTT